MTAALLLDPVFKSHATGEGHPESPLRVEAIQQALLDARLVEKCAPISPRLATVEELSLAHSPDYVEWVLSEIASGAEELAGGDVSICRESGEIARLAAGGVLNAVDSVMERRASTAFCCVRPPGHHASQNRAMGFCIFNNVAIAARHARAKHGAGRIAILDWDVHHGNGTQDIFYHDGAVLFCSTHQFPWYPGTGMRGETGEGPGAGLTINRPFGAGAGRREIVGAFLRDFLPAVAQFRPDLILISAGFDSRIGDPLGDFRLDDRDFADMTLAIMDTASACCGGRVVSVLEGGYSLPGLASAATVHLQTLLKGSGAGAAAAQA